MTLIPTAIVIGIIEDKIANELTGNNKKTIQHLEDVKEKIKKRKPTQKTVIHFKNKEHIDFLTLKTEMTNNFIILYADKKYYFSLDTINYIEQTEV